MIAVNEIGRPHRAAGRRDDGVELVFGDHRIDSLGSRHAVILCQRFLVGLAGQRTLLLSALEQLLAEVGHLTVAVLFVESNQIGERPRLDVRRKRSEIFVEVRFELEEEHIELAFVVLPGRGHVRRIDDSGSEMLDSLDRLLHQPISGIVEAEILSGHTDPRAAQTVRIEELRVVFLCLCRLRDRVALVGSGQRAEENRRVSHAAAHRAGRVLAVRDRNDSGAADQAERRFDSDQPRRGCRADH